MGGILWWKSNESFPDPLLGRGMKLLAETLLSNLKLQNALEIFKEDELKKLMKYVFMIGLVVFPLLSTKSR